MAIVSTMTRPPENRQFDNIRIYHECECRIEKIIPEKNIWHHEAHPHTNNIYCFACSPLGIEYLNQNACICDLTSHDDDSLT